MTTAATPRSPQRSAQIHAGGRCELRCPVCDCGSPATSDSDVDATLEGGGGRLLIRGTSENTPELAVLIARARAQGFAEIVVRTNAAGLRAPGSAAALARSGADAVLVPLFSHDPTIHDQIAGRPRALIDTLAGMRALARAGLAIEVEIPILPLSLQTLADVVQLAHRAVPSLRSVRFFVAPWASASLAPSSWTRSGPALAEAVTLCRTLGIATRLSAEEGVPLCALRQSPDLYDAYAFNPAARSSLRAPAVLLDPCQQCAVRGQCAGVVPSYQQAHGERGIVPYRKRPPLMYEQRTTRRRGWTAEQGRAAAHSDILVLRPTVNCNQDCTFCSANETSANVWANHAEMLRAIARAARRGVERLSFSGGEPTLSKHLVEYIHCASRLGIPQVEIVSNAVLLDKSAKVASLVDAGLTEAFVSLHGHDEILSRQATQKVGDFDRTVQGIGHLLDAGVRTAINHVITSRNYSYLIQFVEFARQQFGGRAKISFAFVTPQFKALENIELMPPLSVVMPHLKRALYRALEIGQPFSIGSRQGIPYCFLDEFRAWSDGIKRASSAISEDSFQKQRAPECDRCRYSQYCTGLWRPYVAKFGLGELRPIAGEPVSNVEIDALAQLSRSYPWGVPPSFEDVPEGLRERALETGPPQIETAAAPTTAFVVMRSRPLRLALVGSGRQARRLALQARNVQGISIDAIGSPHALQADLRELGDCPVYDDAAMMLDDIRPEAVIIAAATDAHAALAELAIERGLPVLLEKPPTNTVEQAVALQERAAAAGVLVVPAHNSLHAAGLEELWSSTVPASAVSVVWRRTHSSGDTMRAWNRSAVYQLMYHLLAITGRVTRGGIAEIGKVSLRGDSAPQAIRVELAYGDAVAEVILELTANVEEDVVIRRGAGEEIVWRRQGRSVSLQRGEAARAVEGGGSDIQRMLVNFRAAVLGEAEPAATLEQAIDVMRNSRAVVEALAQAGAPFERPQAPRHVKSKGMLNVEF